MSKPKVLPVNTAGIPFELQIQNRWILWNYEENGTEWAKIPRQPNGRKASSTRSETWSTFDKVMEAYGDGKKYSGIGIVLDGTGLACVDLDDALADDGSVSPFAEQVLADVPGYAEISAGGHGLHVFVDTPTRGPAINKAGPIEFYSVGRYIAVTGHIFRDRAEHVEGVDISEAITRHAGKTIVSAPAQEAGEGDAEADALEALDQGPLAEWSLERVKEELLAHIDADCSRDEWLQVLMALHHQGNGDHDWLEAAIEWSETGGEKFVGEEDVIQRWESFQRDQGGVSIRTLIKRVGKEKVKDHVDKFEKYRDRIEDAADRKELEEVICVEIRDSDELTDLDKQALVKIVQQTLKKKFSVDAPIASVRKLIIVPASVNADASMPDELQSFVWVNRLNAFYDTDRRVEVSMRSMDAMFNRLFPPVVTANAVRYPSASEELTNKHAITAVDDIMYYPGQPMIFEWEGRKLANSWRSTDTVMVEFPNTDSSRRAIEAAQAHVAWMLPDVLEQRLLWSFLAWVLQNPGKRIHWALVLVGGEGTGKTMLAEMMRAILGRNNYGLIDTGSIMGNFSSWAEGHMLKVVEELKMHGHNRYDAANKLKPLITNSEISVEGKGTNQRVVLNTASYLILTNHLDAIPLHDGDRRYAVLDIKRTRIEATLHKAEFDEFGRLFRRHAGAILYWLLGYDDWHPAFEPKGRAPLTDAKLEAIEETRTDAEWVLHDLLLEGGPGIGKNVVATKYLTEAANRQIRDSGGRPPQTTAWGSMMRALGWVRGPVIKWRGAAQRTWVKAVTDSGFEKHWPGNLKEELDKTIIDGVTEEFSEPR